jgi:putative membrane protein
MIEQYNDLAANERTYLAWMRTALALIGFGFVLERFDLLMKAFVPMIKGSTELHHATGGREAGMVIVVVGILILLLSSWRFVQTTNFIKSEKRQNYGVRSVLVLGGIFLLLASFVLFYVCRMTILQ